VRNHTHAPAATVAPTSHRRWWGEGALPIDTVQMHQRVATHSLLSLRPVRVLPELDGRLLADDGVRALLHTAALARGLDPDRLRFTRAREAVCDPISDFHLPSAICHLLPAPNGLS
jgi:hypothetical protein